MGRNGVVQKRGIQPVRSNRLLRKRRRQSERTAAGGIVRVAKKVQARSDALFDLFTSVKVVIQFSSAARCGMEPTKFRPAIDGACCSMLKETPATVTVVL